MRREDKEELVKNPDGKEIKRDRAREREHESTRDAARGDGGGGEGGAAGRREGKVGIVWRRNL